MSENLKRAASEMSDSDGRDIDLPDIKTFRVVSRENLYRYQEQVNQVFF